MQTERAQEGPDATRDGETFEASTFDHAADREGENEGAAWPPNSPADQARRILANRRMRDELFEPGTFGEPAWEILLNLFVAQANGERVSVSSLCIALDIPSTTALRWIEKLIEDGCLMRHESPADRRRAHVDLTPEAAAKLRQALSRMV